MDLTKEERTILLENSLERVLNTAREVALHAVHEDAGMSYDDITYVKPLATKLWDAARNEAFIQAQREQAREMVLQQLWSALALPFDQAYPIVKRFCNAEFRLVMDPRLMEWMRKNSKAILAKHNSGE